MDVSKVDATEKATTAVGALVSGWSVLDDSGSMGPTNYYVEI